MPENIASLVWVVGGGVLVLVIAALAWFIARLINGIDAFRVSITAAVKELSDTIHMIHNDLDGRISDVHTRVKVIEEAGCVAHRSKFNKE